MLCREKKQVLIENGIGSQSNFLDRQMERQNGENEECKKKQIRNWLVDSVKGRIFRQLLSCCKM